MISAILDRFFDATVSASSRQDPDVFRRAKRVSMLCVTFGFWATVFAGIYFALNAPRCALVTLSYDLCVAASLLILRRGRSVAAAANALCLGGCLMLSALSLFSGGSTAPALLWLSCVPVAAVMTSGAVWGGAWLVGTLVTVAVFYIAEALGFTFSNELPPTEFKILSYAGLSGLVTCQFIMVWIRVGIEQRALDALHETNRRLVQARAHLDSLQYRFGFSVEEWTKLKREKAALEFALRQRVALDDADIEAEVNEEEELDDAEASPSDAETKSSAHDLG